MPELLIETQLWNKPNSLITENVDKENGNIVVEGILATAEVKNGNGRYYPRELWEREMDKYQEAINERRATGELDHPESSVVNLKNVSHLIREYWWDGDHVMGKIEILPTPSGNILKELLKAGILLGISSRGMGSVEPRSGGGVTVGDDFELIGWDFVSNPSTHGAFMTPMNESKQIKVDEVCGNYCKAHDLIREIITELS